MEGIKKLKSFGKIYVVLIAAFFLSMILVYCIPTSWIQSHVEQSVEVMENEGEYPMYFFYRHSAIIDIHTDKLMYTSMIPIRSDGGAVKNAVSINDYPRYWHGYQVVLRPLTLVFQIQEIRYLGMMVFHLLFFWSAWLVAKKTKLSNAMLYVVTICSGYIVFLPVCLQFLTTFIVLFSSVIVLLSRYDKVSTLRLMQYFFIIGMVENFFDFLTYPIITLGIPLILLVWIQIQDRQADFKQNCLFTFQGSFAWGMGYALTWAAKWVIAVLVLGMQSFLQTMSVIQFRLEGSEEEPLDRLGTIRRNLKAWLNVQDEGVISWSKIVLLILIVALILIIWKKLKDLRTVGAYVPILFIALYPYIWYMVMSNHSQIHFWYTYRAQLVALFGVLMFISGIIRKKGELS